MLLVLSALVLLHRGFSKPSLSEEGVKTDTVILYAYHETDDALANLKFFLAHGMHDKADFIFIINGVAKFNDFPVAPNVRVIQRTNTCYDLGAYGEVLNANNGTVVKQYEKFILINASLRGPFIPQWSPACWSSAYSAKITAEIKLLPNVQGHRGNRFADKQKCLMLEARATGRSRKDIAAFHHCHPITVSRATWAMQQLDRPSNPFARKSGRHRELTAEHLGWIHGEIRRNPTLYLDELHERLEVAFNREFSLKTMNIAMIKFGITWKRMKPQALERSKLLRAAHQIELAPLDPDDFVFIDESGLDGKGGYRRYGYSLSGIPCVKKHWFNRGGTRISFIPALSRNGGMEYVKVLEGNGNHKVFLDFVMELADAGVLFPGCHVIMDNASIHHGNQIRAIVEDFRGCVLHFLPPYSPDYNPIEEAFATVKQWLRRREEEYEAADDDGKREMIILACDAITPEQSAGLFRHAGYQ
ncbi:hypothetical protein P7C70_g5019, partial [Phenoliferia sp. Uapishka_3]